MIFDRAPLPGGARVGCVPKTHTGSFRHSNLCRTQTPKTYLQPPIAMSRSFASVSRVVGTVDDPSEVEFTVDGSGDEVAPVVRVLAAIGERVRGSSGARVYRVSRESLGSMIDSVGVDAHIRLPDDLVSVVRAADAAVVDHPPPGPLLCRE